MNTPRAGIVLVISAPSGTGKTTLVKRLLEEFPNIGYSLSCTTRPPREGEIDGQDYTFLSKEDFEARRDTGYFAEWAEVYGNYYGSPLPPTREMLAQGRDVLFEIDVQGAAQLHLTIPEALCIFILPPSLPTLAHRLHTRGKDSEEIIAKRLASARRELQEAHWYTHWIINDDLDTAYAELRATYMAATLAPRLCPQRVHRLLNETTGEK